MAARASGLVLVLAWITPACTLGTVSNGVCTRDEECGSCRRCHDGTCEPDPQCSADPCEGVTCDTPPASACVDSSTVRVYAPAGSCSQGECSYAFAEQACALGCEGGACLECRHECASAGTTACTDGLLQTCAADAHGCRAWDAGVTCASGLCADTASCFVCDDQCPSAGTTSCAGGVLHTCVADTQGCLAWGAGVTCGTGLCADTETCFVCDDRCPSAGATSCAGGVLQTCVADTQGCLAWDAGTSCGTGLCADTETCFACDDQCPSAGATSCAGGVLQTCVTDTQGCLAWDAGVTCTSDLCADTETCFVCHDQCPSAGTTSCAGGLLQTCVADAQGCLAWDAGVTCGTGVCADTTTCFVCDDQCPSAGAVACTGGVLQTCVADANGCLAWSASTTCPGGECADATRCGPDLTVTTSTELCGEHFYGRFTVQGGARVTCATGDLTIRADEVLVDSASAIDLSATSTLASGTPGRNCWGDCYCQAGYTGGGGGGNAGAGGATHDTVYRTSTPPGCDGACELFVCAGVAGGPVRGNGLDLDASAGGRGGRGCQLIYDTLGCQSVLEGGRGGGALRLFASRTLTVDGLVAADGEAGLDGASGSGGGAGGTIVLAAPVVRLTGVVSAAPGPGGTGQLPAWATYAADGGDGGVGYVKLLYGDTAPDTTTVTGSTTLSVMPPLDVRSPSHPDPTAVYNDGLATLDLEWSAPFATAAGYWYALDQTADLALTPATGTFTTATHASFPGTAITQPGVWYFHVITVDGAGVAGTVTSRHALTINSAPHVVSSSSHPDQNVWYPSTAVMLAWAPPGGTTAADFTGFWYRLDRDSASTPDGSRAGWTYTTATTVLLTGDADGAPITGFTYHFHVAAEDTAGNTTREAGHFRLQIGPEPAKTSFFGYARDGAGAAVSAVELRLEPYGTTVTSGADGYFLFGPTYEGAYVLTASKPGWSVSTEQVEITPGTAPHVVTLSP